MKYIITESQNEKLVIKYLNNEYGDLESYITDEYPESVFYIKDKIVYMEHNLNSNNLWIDYYTIWTDLKNIFGINPPEFRRIIKKWAAETYKLRGVTPHVEDDEEFRMVVKYL